MQKIGRECPICHRHYEMVYTSYDQQVVANLGAGGTLGGGCPACNVGSQQQFNGKQSSDLGYAPYVFKPKGPPYFIY